MYTTKELGLILDIPYPAAVGLVTALAAKGAIRKVGTKRENGKATGRGSIIYKFPKSITLNFECEQPVPPLPLNTVLDLSNNKSEQPLVSGTVPSEPVIEASKETETVAETELNPENAEVFSLTGAEAGVS